MGPLLFLFLLYNGRATIQLTMSDRDFMNDGIRLVSTVDDHGSALDLFQFVIADEAM